MATYDDVEVTLGTGRLLGLFFALVVICAVFFGLGYSLGRSTVPPGMGQTLAAAERTANGEKPHAGAPSEPSAAEAKDLTFYKAVEQNAPDAKLAPEKEDPPPEKVSELAKPAAGYQVQVAAVSKAEDAQALANALRRKNYDVHIGNVRTDRLFRVQIGPFADLKDAEAMRARLNNDGYNPIVKK